MHTFQNTVRDLRTHKWELLGATALPLYITIYPHMYTFGKVERYGSSLDVLATFKNRRAQWLMRTDQLATLAENFLPTFLKDQWGYYDQWMKEEAQFAVFNRKFLETDFTALSDDDLRSLMGQYRKAFEIPFLTNNIIEPLSSYFQHNLQRFLQEEGVNAGEAAHLIESYGQAARYSYVKNCAEEYRHAKNDAEINAILKKYYYLNNDYEGTHPISKETLDQLVKTSPYVVAPIQKNPELPSKAQALLQVMQIVATIQDLRKSTLLEMVSAAANFGKEFAKRSGVPFEDIEYATWAELESGVFDAKNFSARRHASCIMYWTIDGFVEYVGDEAKVLMQEITTHVVAADVDSKEVKGFCASKGKATGRAVIIMHPDEFDRVQPGDILITVMTRPEFLPVMHRAAAFVCDEGGITSHAAIVAREMKKPCVIGTKTGTHIFKDGDLLEVDADKGMVRKLN